MSESTEALKATVEGVGEQLTETATGTEQLSGQATELADEAAEHGWHGMASRMHEVAEALEATAAHITTAVNACEAAAEELGSIDETIPAGEVVAHLSASTSKLEEATSALAGAVERAGEARTAGAEIGQEGMQQATLDLHDRLIDMQEQVGEYRSTSEAEQAAADAYVKRQLGN